MSYLCKFCNTVKRNSHILAVNASITSLLTLCIILVIAQNERTENMILTCRIFLFHKEIRKMIICTY